MNDFVIDFVSFVVGQELCQFIEWVEWLEVEKFDIVEQIKEVMVEVKGCGYDIKVMCKLILICKCDSNDVVEEEVIFDFYKLVLGM